VRRWPGLCLVATDFGIGDRPPKPLDELFRRMLGAEVYRVDLLVEQHRGATALGVLGCHYDSGHGSGSF
jgi:hypothetical protein